jgi:glutaredoxin-like YruB-family protein
MEELNRELNTHRKFYLLIQKSSSEVSRCALSHVEQARESVKGDYGVGQVDVAETRDIHTAFQVDTAPSLLVFDEGKLTNVIRGCMEGSYYRTLFAGETGPRKTDGAAGKKMKKVIVYTTPTCSWCTRIKEHLRTNQVPFREIDVAANPAMAEEMRRKSGQMGVPQTEIDGQMIVGFDRPKIDRLLEIG